MITLYGGGEGFGLPEISPYVTKTEVQLKMAALPYRKLFATPQESPKGQVPFIDANGERVADSTFIRAFLERTYGVDFDEGLNARERAEAWAVERMVENHLSWALAHHRWLIPANFARGPAHFFDDAPTALRETLRADVLERVRATVHAVGIGRHSNAEIMQLAGKSLESLSAILCDKPYLFGDRPCGADATVFAMLAGILTPWFDGELRRQAESFEDLVRYVDRLMAQFYPEFPWGAERPCQDAEAA
jgi:glutathione S-transferase